MRAAMKTSRGLLTMRDRGRSVLRQADPDDGFNYAGDLKREARQSAQIRGHRLGPFVERHYTRGVYDAWCERCRRAVAVVNLDPPHRSMAKVYGTAITKRCDNGDDESQ